jgi:hypothetical protein
MKMGPKAIPADAVIPFKVIIFSIFKIIFN